MTVAKCPCGNGPIAKVNPLDVERSSECASGWGKEDERIGNVIGELFVTCLVLCGDWVSSTFA